jgi:para-nitrobenzyl esterase
MAKRHWRAGGASALLIEETEGGAAMSSIVVETRCGPLAGAQEHGIAVFRCVPFAAPPVGNLRFAPPAAPASWRQPRDATKNGPIPPQPPSRLDLAMGAFQRAQDEDCLTLTVHTPKADAGKRPVLVFLHGGAFMSGAGSLDWYSGAGFARHEDCVHVGVNYRLGALGWLYLPGVAPGNLGLRDQIAALAWVRENIAAFGGDPANVTVYGQSAGGISIFMLMAIRESRGLFGRAIIQSGPLGLKPQAPETAAETGKKLAAQIGGEARLMTAPWAEILAGQVALMRSAPPRIDASPPFMPLADGTLLTGEIRPAALEGSAGKGVMIGTTRDEMYSFFAINEAVTGMDEAAVAARFADVFGANGAAALAEYKRQRPGGKPWEWLGDCFTDRMFQRGSLDFAERLAEAGRPGWLYRFDWAAPDNAFGAGHCIELPFLFHDPQHWNAPMTKGGRGTELAGIGAAMRRSWAAFARTGDPANAAIPAWPRYDAKSRATLLFDRVTALAGDPAGCAWRKHWPAATR